MNPFNALMKILATAAVIAGAVFAVIMYGDKIADFTRKLLGRLGVSTCPCEDEDFVDESDLEEVETVAAEQDVETVATEQDFEG